MQRLSQELKSERSRDDSDSSSDDIEQPTIDLGWFAPYLVSRLHGYFQTLLQETLETWGLLVADWRVLLCLSRCGSTHIGEVVRFTSLPQATVSRSIGRLQDKGLLMRKPAEDDGRSFIVSMSDAGKDVLQKIINDLKPTVESELRRLVGERRGDLLKLLREAVRNAHMENIHDLAN